MAIKHQDGCYQSNPNLALYLWSDGDIEIRSGDAKEVKIGHASDIDEIILKAQQLVVDKNTDIQGHLSCDSFLAPARKLFISGNNSHENHNPYYDGIHIVRTTNTVEITPLSGEAPDKIYIDGDPSVLGLAADYLVYIKGSKIADGFWEIASLGSDHIIIKTIPSFAYPQINDTVITGVYPGSPFSKLSTVAPGFLLFDEDTEAWHFGCFSMFSGAPHPLSTLKIVGYNSDPDTTFQDHFPNLRAKGTSSSNSGAKQVGLNTIGFSSITANNVQDAFSQIDSGATITKAASNFIFSENNVIGALNQYISSNSEIALFRNLAATNLIAGAAASKGVGTHGSRDDHIHGVPVGIPVDIGLVNAEGTSPEFARRDHVHKFDSSVSPILKSGATVIPDVVQELTITYATPFDTETTSVVMTFESTSSATAHLTALIIEKDRFHFKVRLPSALPAGYGYKLNWIATGN